MSNKTFSWFSSKGIAAIAFILAITYFLLVEHRQHVVEFLPFLIILLCPLMHIFMHRGHGGHSHGGGDDAYRRGFEDGKKQSSNSGCH